MTRERLLDEYVPWLDYANDSVVLFRDGSAFCMFELDGQSWETADEKTVVYRRDRLEVALRNMATDGLIFHSLQCRGLADPAVYPDAPCRSGFARDLDRRYRENLFDRAMWLNRLYLGLQLRPRHLGGEWFEEIFAPRRKRKIEDETPAYRIERLMRIAGILREQLEDYQPRLLGVVRRGRALFSEIAEAVAFAITGYWRAVPLTVGSAAAIFSEVFIVGQEAFEIRLPTRRPGGRASGCGNTRTRHGPGYSEPR